jgi:putative hydrolase of the HAD superfamily
MTTRAVLFDLGNTLVHYYRRGEFSDVLRRCLQSTVSATALTSSDVDADQLFERALELNRESADFAVRPLAARMHELLPSADIATAATIDAVCRAFMAPIFACARPDPSAAPVLVALRAHGIRLAVVSNTPWGSPAAYWREELDRHGLLGLLDASVFCVDVGWRKPHPAPMQQALAALDVAAENSVFVGDDPRWDVEGARRAGIRPILLSPAETPASVNCAVIPDLRALLSSAEML